MKNAVLLITKVLLILSMSLCLFLPTHFSYAEELTPDNYGTPGDTTGAGYDEAFMNKYGGKISSFCYGIAIIVTLVSITGLGVKYITAGITQKAEYKKEVIPIVIGVVLVVFIFSIVGFIAKAAETI